MESNDLNPNPQHKPKMDAVFSSLTASVPLLMGGENSAFKTIGIQSTESGKAPTKLLPSHNMDSSATSEICEKKNTTSPNEKSDRDSANDINKVNKNIININKNNT